MRFVEKQWLVGSAQWLVKTKALFALTSHFRQETLGLA